MTTAQHPVRIAHPVATAASGIDAAMIVRRFTLFIGMLMSGGLLLFPRPVLLALIFILAFATRPKTLGLRREMLPIPLFLLVVLLLSGINDGFSLEPLAIRIANFAGGILLLGVYSGLARPTLARDMFFILKWMSVQAIATVVLGVVARPFFQPLDIYDISYQTIFLVFTYHAQLDSVGALIRPDGFFFEPGVFQMYLNLFVYLALFVFKSRRHALVGLVAVLATQSTTGYIIATALVGAAAYRHLVRVNASQIAIAGMAGALIVLPIAYLTYQNFQIKTVGELRGSGWAREYDLRTGLAIIAEHPVTGIGFSTDRYLDESRRLGFLQSRLGTAEISERTNSNGLVLLAATVGIPLALLVLFALFNQPLLPDKWIVFGVVAVSSLSESILLTPFLLIFIFGGMLSRRRNNVSARR